MSKLSDPNYWRAIAPHLSISDRHVECSPVDFSTVPLAAISKRFHEDGYLHLQPVFDADELGALRQGIVALGQAGLPPVFIYLYDQPFILFAKLRHLIGHFLGPRFALLPNFWAWNVPLQQGASGWPAHQDCQAQTRFPSGDGGDVLMSLSLWIPLTDATPDNGCMSVLPRSNERHYDLPLDDPSDIRAEHGVALPAKAGSVLGWPQDLYHWSNTVTENASKNALEPRLSLSLEFQNPAFDPLVAPLLDVARPPSFETRLELVRQQFPKYQHMEDSGFDVTQICDKLASVT